MPKEIFPSSYECDCGHQSHFFENTIREAKTTSRKKEVRLADSEPDEHVIVFYRGEMTEIICPHQPQRHSSKKGATKKRRSKKSTTRSSIPDEVQKQVDDIVKRFNETKIRDPNRFYIPRYRGKFLYLDRDDYGFLGHVCRLKYTGDMNDWNFAIYKYSDGCYDPDEWMFPGEQHVDGTIEGAMKAGLKAYPD
jgi:hypothetical protein